MASVSFNTGLVTPGQASGRLADYQPALTVAANAKAFYFIRDIAANIVANRVNLFPAATDNTPLRVNVVASDTSVAVTVSTT